MVTMGRKITSAQYWLRGCENPRGIGYAVFTPTSHGFVHVLAITGAASYIDAGYQQLNAREIYRRLRQNGWVPVTTAEVEAVGMNEHVLRAASRD